MITDSQLEIPEELESPEDPSPLARARQMIADYNNQAEPEAKQTYLSELLNAYDLIETEDEELARQIRQIFVQTMEHSPELIAGDQFTHFLIDKIEIEDFTDLTWDAPHEVLSFWENLHSFRIHKAATADHLREQISHLLKTALQQFERKGEFEKMFQLIRLAPFSIGSTDPELIRLNNRAYFYEMRRARRNRRWLFVYLIVQVFLVVGVFPFLFINAENGRIQKEIEQVTDVELPEDPGRQYLGYGDGLYWSLITAASIGYGDITPRTRVGKIIAAILGVMGVVTIGVIAGLILQWITPRRLT